MSNIDKCALREAAEKATPGPWYVHDKPCEDGNYGIDTSDKEFLAEAVVWWGFARQSIWREEDAKHIAAANPSTVLALLDELEAAGKRIAELEAREVVLPSAQDVHPLGPQSAKIFCEFHRSIVNRCADEIRKVGVKVSIKGN
ncbi:ead/Ea22-like family protein [Enterobacter hormaechei]|uniref:ead/Ea22-like family protein n=1 Tax=Enterobacter hormaechei TaxID=158836 RepID=UPI002949088A|nr:ead/Ea22-like family protein [Enterobacter hormaechei]MDV5847443.1 ead/Ea22-like family protein [Enterobacter hormaechei]